MQLVPGSTVSVALLINVRPDETEMAAQFCIERLVPIVQLLRITPPSSTMGATPGSEARSVVLVAVKFERRIVPVAGVASSVAPEKLPERRSVPAVRSTGPRAAYAPAALNSPEASIAMVPLLLQKPGCMTILPPSASREPSLVKVPGPVKVRTLPPEREAKTPLLVMVAPVSA